MTIKILTDNRPGPVTGAEHGLSYLIEHDNKTVLFDTGQSDLFLRNARIMGLNVNAENIVLSHGHYDHGNGLNHLHDGKLICHPGCFVKRFRKADHSPIGLKNSKEEIATRFELITATDAYQMAPRIIFLGEIPRITDFESIHTSFILEDGKADFVMDDSAIALQTDQGLFVVTGCGHAGIVNTIEHARKVTGEKRIAGIMGGFHLKRVSRQTKETIRYLKQNGIFRVYPSHCTQDPALELFHESFGSDRVKTGDTYHF